MDRTISQGCQFLSSHHLRSYPHTDAFSSLLSRAPIGPIPPPIWFALVTSDLKMRVKTFFEMSVPVRQTSQKALNIRLSLSLFSLFFYSDLPTNHCRIWSHTMTHTHTHTHIPVWSALDERSAAHRDPLYVTTHNTHKETDIHPLPGFEPTITAS